MSNTTSGIAAEAEKTNEHVQAGEIAQSPTVSEQTFAQKTRYEATQQGKIPMEDLPVHGFSAVGESAGHTPHEQGVAEGNALDAAEWEREYEERTRRIYRGRTVAMLRRYMQYSHETGRLPSLLGREFFRAKVTCYTVVTFEDRVIFVHDMERCLERLDEFSRQLIARHILQEHNRWATARLLHCNEKTVRRLTPLALDLLSEILLEVGLLEKLEDQIKPCQEGLEGEICVSDCEDGKNKF